MYEEDLFDDLAYEEAEGAADFYDEFDEFDELDEYDEFDEYDELDEFDDFDDYDEFDEYDELDEYDDFDEYDEFDDFEDDAMDDAMAYALDSEDADEFFKKLFRGIKKVAKKVAPVIGKVARVAAPILSKIPHPYAQIGSKAARLLGRLRAEGASEEEALEVMAEVAVRDKRAIPLVAGLAAKTVLKSKGKAMSHGARKKVVKDMKKAAKILVRRRGRKAIRALPKIAKSVKRTAAVKRQPGRVRGTVVKKTAAKVARSSTLTRKLAKPTRTGKRAVRKAMGGRGTRSFTIPGPSRVTVSRI